MAASFEGLEPKNLWKHFNEFLKIPHCSGNEKELGDYIISVAEGLNLEWKRDETGNVLVSKPGSPGHENAVGVILQGHLDMVCEKNSNVDHDFSKDAIKIFKKDEWIQAEGTTLGADNAIGCCAGLAILEDNRMVHPPIECLFTVDEETGLTGATKIQPGFLKGRILLNLDSEEEGEFTIGCAGGADTKIFLSLSREESHAGELYRVKLSGFRGGHSGIDINKGRGNAVKLLSRILWQVLKTTPFKLISFEGGNLRNAIPRESWAHVLVAPDHIDAFSVQARNAFAKIKNEYQAIEADAALSVERWDESTKSPLTDKNMTDLINLLLALPHGVISMHPEIEGLVETSNNLAVIHTHDDKAEIICSTRSSAASALDATRNVFSALGEIADAEVQLEEGYPGWTPNLQSPVLKTLKDVYQRTFSKEPEVAAVHAGLECGIIGEKFPGMDMISFGPTIEHPHSPDERVNIESVEFFWTFLTTILAELA